jgi:hypothetical protein
MIYVVMMKELATQIVTPVAAFTVYADATVWMNRAIDADEDYAYKIETVNLNPVSLAF